MLVLLVIRSFKSKAAKRSRNSHRWKNPHNPEQ